MLFRTLVSAPVRIAVLALASGCAAPEPQGTELAAGAGAGPAAGAGAGPAAGAGAGPAAPTGGSAAKRADAQPARPADAPGARPRPAPAAGATSRDYGFRGFEIYRVGNGTNELAAGDVDGDGFADLVLVDNRRSRLEILRRLPQGAPDRPDPDLKSGPNVLTFDGRFERVRQPVERRVLQLALCDWNADAKDDIAWIEDDGTLALRTSSGGAGDSAAAGSIEKRRLDAARKGCAALVAADVTGDGREDLLVATATELLVLAAQDGRLGEPTVLDRYTSPPARFWCTQLDGFGGPDLLYAYLGAEAPLRWRLGVDGLRFGPRVELDMPQLRSATLAPPRSDGTCDVLGVFKVSGRLSQLSWSVYGNERRPPLVHSLPHEESKDAAARGFAVDDLDGDGACDVLVTDPGPSQLTVLYGTKGAHGLLAVVSPTLTGVSAPHAADVDGDGRADVVVISASERMLGLSRAGAGRALDFPRTVPIDGEPAALDVRDLDRDGKADAVLVVAQGEGRNRKHRLEIWMGSAQGFAAPPRTFALDGLKKTPSALKLADLDHDGDLDALAFLPGEKAVPALIFAQDGAYVADERGEDAPGLGVLAGASPRSVSFHDVDGDSKPELVVAHANFARALAFEVDGAGRAVPRVVEQFNAPSSEARLSAALFVDVDGDGKPELVVRDDVTRDLSVLARDPSSQGVREQIYTGRLDFAGLAAGDLDADGKNDLVILGQEEIGLVYGAVKSYGYVERASYEPGEERVVLDQLVCADLGGDSSAEIVATEISRHALVILERDGSALAQRLGFTVYEKRTFEGDEPEREPREIVAADLDGDGKQDLALLVHDKLIVYLQE